MPINLMAEAQDKIVKRFKLASVTEGIFSNDYSWNGVNAIDVYTLDTITLGTYDRTEVTSSRFGTMVELGDTKQTLTITQEKGFEVSVDAGNDIQLPAEHRADLLRESNIQPAARIGLILPVRHAGRGDQKI